MVRLQCVSCVATAVVAAAVLLVSHYNSWGPFHRDEISVEHGRNLIFQFTGPAFCWVGVNAGLVTLPLQLPIPLAFLNSCICKDYQIAERLATASTSFTFATTITLCGGTVLLEKPIDLTGKNVVFLCQTPGFLACGFNGNGKSRIIDGSPLSATFRQMKFENGNAMNERKNVGGAMYLEGGTVVMDNVGFIKNEAGAGGAIFLERDATVTISKGSFFDNRATKQASSGFVTAMDGMTAAGGGAIYNSGGLVVVDNGGGFFDNEAVGNGGAILTSIGTVRLGNITLSGNQATLGDAIASLVSIVTLSGTRFEADGRRRRYLKDDKYDDKRDKDDRGGSRDSKPSEAPSRVPSRSPSKTPVIKVPTLSPVKPGLGMGNLIYIADDMAPTMSFVDCDTDPKVEFCGGIDVFEVGRTFMNTNCQVNGLDELSEECDDH